ncbi:MAG: serine/threonine-protein kinase [Steroidobacteraceae bacterium]
MAVATRARLDALMIGAYDRRGLLREAYLLAKKAPEDTCEILSVVDQHFRRGTIDAAEYRQLKSQLGVLLVNGAGDTPHAGPPPRRRVSAVQLECTEPVAAARPAAGLNAAVVSTRLESSSTQAASDARTSADSKRGLAVGDTLRGRYRVTGIVGQGGMGTVYEVIDQYLTGTVARDRRLAVKMLHTETTQRRELSRELLSEFLNLRSLSHPNIVRVHDFDRDGDRAFFTMELLDGSSLGRVVAGRGGTPFASEHARAIVHAVGIALAHAHSHGIVHGDVNPKNIFLTGDGEVRVLDFGASRGRKSEPLIVAGSPAPPKLAATLRYASCEVLEAHPADALDDLFALACVAYVVLSGRHPFANRTAIEARAAGLRPVRPRGLSARQWRALRQGLDLRRDRRPSDIGQWVLRLNAGETLQPLPVLPELLTVQPERNGTALAAALAAVLMLSAAGGLWVAHAQESLRQPAVTALADTAAALVTARTSFVHLWNQALRSAVIGEGAGDGAPAALPPVRRSPARAHQGPSGESSSSRESP